jgi:hypothetical protein
LEATKNKENLIFPFVFIRIKKTHDQATTYSGNDCKNNISFAEKQMMPAKKMRNLE